MSTACDKTTEGIPIWSLVIIVLLYRISTNAQVTMALQLEQMKLLCLSHTCIIFLQPTVKNTSLESKKKHGIEQVRSADGRKNGAFAH
jgi:hypothetical protein